MHPLVSVIIPVYNRQHTLDRLFESLKRITYPNVEILLVDNSSSDSSLSKCKSFAEEINCDKKLHPQFTANVLCESKKGASAARNLGLHECKGELVYFFDSDDEISPDFISKMVECFAHDSQTDLVVARTVMVMPDKKLKARAFVPQASVGSHILSATLSTQSFMARRSYVISIGGWNEDVPKWNDYELGIRLLLHTDKIQWISGAYHRIYQHEDSITGSSLSSTFDEIVTALHIIEGVLRDAEQYECKQQDLLALYFREEILAGKLLQEGSDNKAKRLYSDASTLLLNLNISERKRNLARFIGRSLRKYTAKDGRGAWRIALHCCKLLASLR